MQQGLFIVLEGADGSGKATQFRLLSERLRAVGYDVEVFDFPRYNEPSSHFVQNYLKGRYGPASEINPYMASLFYALDRFEAAANIRKALKEDKVVLSNRYVGSNMAHQGAKLADPVEQRSFFVWEDSLEFQLLGIPRPTLNLFLRVPAEISQRLIKDKAAKNATQLDQHEQDIDHLRKSVATYDLLCQLFPKDFKAIDSTRDDKLLSITEINDKIWAVVRPLLIHKPPHRGHSVTIKLDKPQEQQKKTLQEPGSRELIKVPASGQGLSFELKNISLLTASFVESAQGVKAVLTQPAWRGEKNGYKHYALSDLPQKISRLFVLEMDELASLHQQMQNDLRRYWQRHKAEKLTPSEIEKRTYGVLIPTTPLAALVSIKIVATPIALRDLMNQLGQSELSEMVWLGQQLQTIANKQRPDLFIQPVDKKANSPQLANGQFSDVISKLAKIHLPQNLPADIEPLKLLDFWPRNEFELLADSMYPYSSLSRADLAAEIDGWSYEQKRQTLLAALKQPGGVALKQARYHWDVIDDRLTLANLIKLQPVENIQTQPPSPRYGYEVPELIEQAGLEDLYLRSFDLSLKLFSSLQAAGREDIALYATLLGHKIRWQFSNTARTLALDKSQSRLTIVMKDKVAQMQPLVGEVISLKSSGPSPKPLTEKSRTQINTNDQKPRPKRRKKGPRPTS